MRGGLKPQGILWGVTGDWQSGRIKGDWQSADDQIGAGTKDLTLVSEGNLQIYRETWIQKAWQPRSQDQFQGAGVGILTFRGHHRRVVLGGYRNPIWWRPETNSCRLTRWMEWFTSMSWMMLHTSWTVSLAVDLATVTEQRLGGVVSFQMLMATHLSQVRGCLC